MAELTLGSGIGCIRRIRWEWDLALWSPPAATGSTELQAPAPADSSYAVFTSGSMACPKGTIIEHRSIVNRLRWMDAVFR